MRSVASALAQERPPLEVLVVCDGCTDGTQEALAALGDPRVVVLDLPKGPGYGLANRNVAVQRARGDVLAHLGDDDLWLPEHLTAVGTVWDAAGPGALDIVQSGAVLLHPDDALEPRLQAWAGRRGHEEIVAGICRMPIGTVTVTRDLLRAAGGWRDRDAAGGDQDLWRRCAAATRRERIGTSVLPTLLWLQTSTREQGYADHVAQLERWSRRVEHRVGEVRAAVAVAWADAAMETMSGLREARGALAWEREVHARARMETAAARAETDGARAALAREREAQARCEATLRDAEARAAAARATVDAQVLELRAREAELADALRVLASRDADLAYLRGVEAQLHALITGRWHRLGRRLRRLAARR